MTPEWIHCALCNRIEWKVSVEDPDSTMADAIQHMMYRHPEATYGTGVEEGRIDGRN